MIFVEVKTARKQEELQFHVFYASPEGPLVGTIPFHDAEGALGLNASVHAQQRAMDRVEIIDDLLV